MELKVYGKIKLYFKLYSVPFHWYETTYRVTEDATITSLPSFDISKLFSELVDGISSSISLMV